MSEDSKDKEVDDSLKIIAKTSIFIFVAILLSKIFFYFYRIIIARNFGIAIYGTFSLSLIIFSFLVAISSLGFYQGILRFIPFYRGTKKINNIRYIFRFSVLISAISSIFFGLILFFSSEFISINLFHDSNLIIFLKILALALPFYIVGSVFLGLVMGFEKIKVNSFISEFLQSLVKLISLVLFVYLGVKIYSIVLSHLIGILVVFFVAYFYCRYKLPETFKKYVLSKKSKKEINRKFFLYSIPLIFSNIIYDLFGYLDSSVIGFFNGPSSVGIYNAALPIAYLLTFLPSLFIPVFFPMIIREFSEKKINVVRELSKQVQKWILIINIPLFALMFLFSGAFVNILFGSQYIGAEQALRILSVGFFLYSIAQVLINLILVVGKSKIFLIDITILSLFNLILNILLIQKYGINGVAFSTTLSYIILTVILFFQVKHYLDIIPIRRRMLRVLIAVAVPSLILFYIRQLFPINLFSIILLCSFFLLLYILLIFLTKSLDKNDFEILKLFKRKITRK